jgi:hypothetical protein
MASAVTTKHNTSKNKNIIAQRTFYSEGADIIILKFVNPFLQKR